MTGKGNSATTTRALTLTLTLSVTLCLTLTLSGKSNAENIVLTSPMVTDFGEWTSWSNCPPGYFVIAADLHHDSVFNILGHNDDLGVTNIVLECKSFLDKEAQSEFIFTQVEGIQASILAGFKNGSSHLGNKKVVTKRQINFNGTITAEVDIQYPLPLRTQCDGLAIGFAINSAEQELARDNTATNNIRLYCSNLKRNAPAYVDAYGLYDGEWSEEQLCGREHAICGIQAQAESMLSASEDHVAVNSLRFKCCRIPNPASTCQPTDSWELVAECDNIESSSNIPLTCAYTHNVGVGASSTKLKDEYEDYILNEGLGFTLEESELAVTQFWLASGLSQNFKDTLGLSEETNHDWGVTSARTWTAEKSIDGKVEVDLNLKAFIYQVVGKCSYFTARTNSFRRVDTDSASPRNMSRVL